MKYDWLSWTYSGVDFSLAGNGGNECAAFIPTFQRVLETLVMVCIGIVEMYIAYPRLTLCPSPPPPHSYWSDKTGKRLLLVVVCLIFGVELGFKFATRQMVWVLNPCHVVTICQIFLLFAPPSRLARVIFRLQIHLLSGATVALVFPVINTRLLLFEKEVYFLQHILMLITPLYLMSLGGAYTVEELTDPYWVLFALGLMVEYHFVVLQGLGLLSLVNLNSMLCPAISDPFYGPYYRVYAAFHQTALVLIHGKIYTILSKFIIHFFLTPTHTAPAPAAYPQITSNGRRR